MPTGPNGEKRPDDPIAAAVMVAKIATGQIEEEYEIPPNNGSGGCNVVHLSEKKRNANSSQAGVSDRRGVAD